MKKQHLLFVVLAATILVPLQSLKAMDDANSSMSLSSVLKSPPVFIVGTIVAGVALSRYLISSDQTQLEQVIKTSTNVEGVMEAQKRVACKTILADRLLMAVRNNSLDEALICLNAGCLPHAATNFIGSSTGNNYTPIEATHVWNNPALRELFKKY